MTHELESILLSYQSKKQKGIRCVLASVVDLDGSSYRKPGVRMLIDENQKTIGAVSGGCVEKDIVFQSLKVFESGKSLMMSYDGRYRLGCEGNLFILIEPIDLTDDLINLILNQIENRNPLKLKTYYRRELSSYENLGTEILFKNNSIKFHKKLDYDSEDLMFEQHLPAKFKLFIIGAEHDTVALTQMTNHLGWIVEIIASPDEQKELSYFDGANALHLLSFEEIKELEVDKETAILLMTHSLQKDLQYLLALEGKFPLYFGLLGPKKRKEDLLNKLLEFKPDIDLKYISQLKGPMGLDLGGESAHEIGLSILSEILSVNRKSDAIPLSQKKGSIHD